jgi:hypothetical protein
MVVDDFDTCGWDPARDPWRALCHLEDEPEDGLSDCKTVFACPDSNGDGSHFDDDTYIYFAGESSRLMHSLASTFTLLLLSPNA